MDINYVLEGLDTTINRISKARTTLRKRKSYVADKALTDTLTALLMTYREIENAKLNHNKISKRINA